MVRHTDAAGCYVLAKLVEIAVTQCAGSHFDGYLMQFGVTLCVKVYSVQFDAHLLAQCFTEFLIAVALFTA